MTRALRSLAALGLCVITPTACLDTVDPVEANFALLNLHATQQGSDYTVSPVAVFFRASGVILSSSNRTQDLCGEVDWPVMLPLQDLFYLDAGPFVTATVSGSEATLHPRVVNGAETYELDAGSITHSPGDTVEFSIPAATSELPATTSRARTADLFEPSVVDISQSSPDAVVFTWTPSPEDGSVMAYELRYARQGSPDYDRELLCFFMDDGEASVSPALVAGFAGSNLRLAKATRQRISTFPGANTVVHITSTLELPVTVNVTP
jgi:hypothetical protein